MYAKRPKDQNNVKPDQMEKNQAVLRLLEEWIADEPDNHAQEWQMIKQEIEDNRLSARRRFHE